MLERTDFPTIIDSSMLGTFKACQQHFRYQYLHHLSPVAKSIHLIAGGAFAKGLETARLHYHLNIEGCLNQSALIQDAIHKGMFAAILEWGHHDLHADSPKWLGNILIAIEAYFNHHGFATDLVQPYKYQKGDKANYPAVEFSFALPIGIDHPSTGEPLLYTGRFDLLGVFNGALFAVDEKTTTRLGPTWSNQWDLRSQFTGYCWAAQQYGYPVAGVIVRGMSILKNDFGFAEVISYRPAHLIQRWMDTTQYYIRQMIDCWQRDQWIHQLDGACTAYSGCPFRIVCDKAQPEDWLDSNFTRREWNPLMGEGSD